MIFTVFSIHKGKDGNLPACHEFFDYDLVSRRAELFIHHQLTDSGPGLRKVLADQHALSQGQPVGL